MDYLKNNFNKNFLSIDVLVNIARKQKLFLNIPSTQSIYKWIKLNLIHIKKHQLLRSSNKYKRRRKSLAFNKRRKMHRIPIHMRPSYINERKVFGHWECDCITCKQSNYRIVTLVERMTRYAITLKTNLVSMDQLYIDIKNKIIDSNLKFKSVTFDNGPEFNEMYRLKDELGIKVYYCHPYAPSERGTNEVFNGWIRRFIPKGFNIDLISIQDLKTITNIINKTPRKILNWRSSLEVLNS